eukprot:COSAG05_NODE_168_length_15164_cov_8.323734_9_plen_103_part_00
MSGSGSPQMPLASWPFFTPQGSGIMHEIGRREFNGANGADGAISAVRTSCVRVQMLAGSLTLRTLIIDGHSHHHVKDGVLASANLMFQPGEDTLACTFSAPK